MFQSIGALADGGRRIVTEGATDCLPEVLVAEPLSTAKGRRHFPRRRENTRRFQCRNGVREVTALLHLEIGRRGFHDGEGDPAFAFRRFLDGVPDRFPPQLHEIGVSVAFPNDPGERILLDLGPLGRERPADRLGDSGVREPADGQLFRPMSEGRPHPGEPRPQVGRPGEDQQEGGSTSRDLGGIQ